MIRPGDRILLGLSGGKDSLSLLHVLLELRHKAQVRFELGAATVDPCIEGFDPSFLKDYVAVLGVPYFYRRQDIVGRALKTMRGDSFCAYCSRMRRGILYATAREQGYNVLALAHHLDDLAESFLMSAFYGGTLRTMKAHYVNDAGDLRIIRPFVYARERQTRDFAVRAGLPQGSVRVLPPRPPHRAVVRGARQAERGARQLHGGLHPVSQMRGQVPGRGDNVGWSHHRHRP